MRVATAEACAGAEAHGPTAGAATTAVFLHDPARWHSELLRYGAAAAFTIMVAAILVHTMGNRPATMEVAETQDAVFVDLPPALASSRPARGDDEEPEQQASAASPATPTPPKSAETVKPIDELSPRQVERAEEKPPEERKAEPAVAAPAPPVTAQAPAGAETPAKGERLESGETQQQASAQAINAWQLSLVGRLETAKRKLPRGARRPAGTVQIAFDVDGEGKVVSDRVARSSGSAALDDVALALVRGAAPFPRPPSGTGSREMSFVVPIRFKR